MKKIIPVLILLFVLAVVCIYIFFPAYQTLTQSVRLHVPQKALYRVLTEQSRLQKQAGNPNDTTKNLLLVPDGYEGFIVTVPYKGTVHNSLLKLIPLRTDTTFVHWNGVVQGGTAPWQRVQTWVKGRQIKKEVQQFLSTLHQWEQSEQVYGFKVAYEKVKDTAFIATRFVTTAYPSTEAIYKHIELLQAYAALQGATVVRYPMLHVQAAGKSFEIMVALPVNRPLPAAGALEPKRMITGNILSAEVKGGAERVEKGMQQLENYVIDHGHKSPAIPYASLVTNRMKERDSTRWITKLYYPIY